MITLKIRNYNPEERAVLYNLVSTMNDDFALNQCKDPNHCEGCPLYRLCDDLDRLQQTAWTIKEEGEGK